METEIAAERALISDKRAVTVRKNAGRYDPLTESS